MTPSFPTPSLARTLHSLVHHPRRKTTATLPYTPPPLLHDSTRNMPRPIGALCDFGRDVTNTIRKYIYWLCLVVGAPSQFVIWIIKKGNRPASDIEIHLISLAFWKRNKRRNMSMSHLFFLTVICMCSGGIPCSMSRPIQGTSMAVSIMTCRPIWLLVSVMLVSVVIDWHWL